MENKLQAYRAKKQRENLINSIKNKFKTVFTRKKSTKMIKLEMEQCELTEKLLPATVPEVFSLSENDGDDDEDLKLNCCTYPKLIFYSLCFILWVVSYSIFIKLQFGTAFLVISAILGMYFNTRTGPKKKDEISAYSVFNKNCESIDGTLKAEQFEREIRYGPASVR